MKNAAFVLNSPLPKHNKFMAQEVTAVGTRNVATTAVPITVIVVSRIITASSVDNSPKRITLSILVPAAPAAVAYWYRENRTSPLHALGAELWIGNNRVAKIEPVHCLGLTEMQIKTLLVRILDGFSQHSGIKIERFRSSVELNPLNCPIRSCPLHPTESDNEN